MNANAYMTAAECYWKRAKRGLGVGSIDQVHTLSCFLIYLNIKSAEELEATHEWLQKVQKFSVFG